MSTPCFVANWKMYKGIAEAQSYLQTLEKRSAQGTAYASLFETDRAEIILAPPFTALSFVSEFLKRSSLRVDLAAQNVHYEGEGAFTGEVSPSMLRDVGCRYVIIGHSERRQFFGETDAEIHRKLNAIIKCGLRPILCIGETLQERQDGKTGSVLEHQLKQAFGKFLQGDEEAAGVPEWIIAYEPVWAIGTGQTPTPGEVGSVLQQIGKSLFEGLKSRRPRVLYGGSVNEGNIEIFMKEQALDGVLVGGASLSADKFLEIIKRGTSVKKD
ncbi:MAG: triose-phosphate isomerase [Nitrospira sp.]|nr:triose-phosphate isomerase [Candidatus Manganitrophaceae bacterium]HIL34132.1 triose-phosphate isomerase [Candidatus Manganitrophaceae bacterium]